MTGFYTQLYFHGQYGSSLQGCVYPEIHLASPMELWLRLATGYTSNINLDIDYTLVVCNILDENYETIL